VTNFSFFIITFNWALQGQQYHGVASFDQEPIEWISPDEATPTAASNGNSRLAEPVQEGEPAGLARNGTAAGHEAESGLAESVELGGQQPGGFNPFLSLPTERNACDYKRGYVIR
jgi:hypothetical protein